MISQLDDFTGNQRTLVTLRYTVSPHWYGQTNISATLHVVIQQVTMISQK